VNLKELEFPQLKRSADITGRSAASGSVYDLLGVSASTLCALHCGVFPLLLTAAPWFAIGSLAEETFEGVTIGLSLAIGMFALTRGFRLHHRKWSAFRCFFAGAVIIVSAKFLLVEFERLLLPVGAMMIALSHIQNWRLCKGCVKCK
jgi:hypothetical protein